MPRRPATRASRAVRASALPTPVQSSQTTPLSSAYPSNYTSEVELDFDDILSKIPIGSLSLEGPLSAFIEAEPKPVATRPFPFLDLPSELRVKIYQYHFAETLDGRAVDLDSDNYKHIHKKLAILRVCRTIYHEASYVFYSCHNFRIFPTTGGRFLKTKKPLLARLNSRQRSYITSLELRLGPGWNKPPRSWVVNHALGLTDCKNLKKLTVFVEFDPSCSPLFDGFRTDGFYENFSKRLLNDVLSETTSLDAVCFDGWSSVEKGGVMMQALLEVTLKHGKKITWGPERGWTDFDGENNVLGKEMTTVLLNPTGFGIAVTA